MQVQTVMILNFFLKNHMNINITAKLLFLLKKISIPKLQHSFTVHTIL